MSGEQYKIMMANSGLISIDVAHARHPNYFGKHEPGHAPLLGKGPVVKYHANQSYATNSGTDAWVDLNITISAGPGTVWCTATNNILYFGSRDSEVFKWTGSGDATAVASSPKGAFGCIIAD